MAKRIPASNQGDTEDDGVKLDLDSDGWQSDYEAMMQASGDWGEMDILLLLSFYTFLLNIEGNVSLEWGVISQPSHVKSQQGYVLCQHWWCLLFFSPHVDYSRRLAT